MRFYRMLLHLYPASFRAEYGDELCRAFQRRVEDFTGPFTPIAIVVAALTDVIPNAIAVHGDMLRQDLRYAFRSLRHTPGFALTAVFVVALGVGANTAAFSVADFVLVRPLPFPDPNRLVELWQASPAGRAEVSPANFRDWRAETSSFSQMGAYASFASNLVGGGEPRRLETVRATPELLPMMGVRPLIGRVFTADDVASGSFAVLSYPLWRSHFGGDRGVVGRSIQLDGVPHTILGVMPATFRFPTRSVDAWTSLVLRDEDFEGRDDTYLNVLARLRPGVSRERAQQELNLVGARLEQQFPRENKDVVPTLLGLRDEVTQNARLLVLALCGAALCIMLLACANLASLFLARGAHRSRELAVRSALGAGRDRLTRQIMTECLGLAIIGGLVGVAAAAAGVPLLERLVPATLPTAGHAAVDLRVLGVALALVLFTGLVFGLAPAAQVRGVAGMDALRSGTRAAGGTQRLRAGLVVVEVAASVVLLITSGLLIRAVWSIQSTDPGFVADRVVTVRTALPMPKYELTERRVQYYDKVLHDVRALPGVREAAYSTGLPMTMRGGIWPASLTGEDTPYEQNNTVSMRFVTPRWFATLGIPVMRGRDVADTDTREQPFAAVVSQSFAERSWPGQDPIGKRFRIAFAERTVVGVVGDVHVRGLERRSEPQVYLPYQQVRDSSIIGYTPKDLAIKTTPGVMAGALLPNVRAIVRSADPEQPISDVRTMSEIVTDETASRVIQLRLLGVLALIALLIAGLGIHGLLSYTVSKRTRELGVRLALGAQTSGIVGLVVKEGMVLALFGISVGGLVAYLAARGMTALLFDVRPDDPATLGLAVAVCLATALLGCVRPALKAARVDPWTALRTD